MKHDFTPYKNPVFIETGTYVGDGVKAALTAGFNRIISIEMSDFYYEVARINVGKYKRVELHHGDSAELLPKILADINEQCTFWLDAHWSDPNCAGDFYTVPLMRELEVIVQHPIKTHTIIIDDMRLIRDGTREWLVDFSVQDVLQKLLSINMNYKITFDKGITKDDIIVAQP